MRNIVEEGLSRIMIFDNVFYNPMAKFNRSLGVVFLNSLGHIINRGDLVVADVMAATGVRGIRYYLESHSVGEVFFNDLSKNAYRCILDNISLNNMRGVSNVTAFNVEKFMSLFTGLPFDFIDVDPFGSPLPYIPPLFNNLRRREGFLAFTATDLMTLCGVHLEALSRKYGVHMIKTDFCHELAIRVILKNIYLVASYYDYFIYPLLATFENQYVRIYLRYRKSPSKIDLNKIGYIIIDDHNYRHISYEVVGSLELTNSRLLGPIWIDSYIDRSFISLMVDRSKEVGQNLNLLNEYKPVTKYLSRMLIDDTSIPYIYRISKLCKKLKVPQPAIKNILEALQSMGYKAYRAFLYPDGIRTDAPINEIFRILKKT